MSINTYLSIITLNINGLNALTKRHRRAEFTRRRDWYIYMCILSRRDWPQNERYKQTKSKGMETVFCGKKMKKAGIAILISDKINFKTTAIVRDQKDTTYL